MVRGWQEVVCESALLENLRWKSCVEGCVSVPGWEDTVSVLIFRLRLDFSGTLKASVFRVRVEASRH